MVLKIDEEIEVDEACIPKDPILNAVFGSGQKNET
jgi:hypothetical protein